MNTLRRQDNVFRAMKLEQTHNVRPSFGVYADTNITTCNLADIHTHEWKFGGKGKDCEEAFQNAVRELEKADSETPASISSENESLRQQLRDMEQKLEAEKASSNSSEASSSEKTATQTMKKTTRRKREQQHTE